MTDDLEHCLKLKRVLGFNYNSQVIFLTFKYLNSEK